MHVLILSLLLAQLPFYPIDDVSEFAVNDVAPIKVEKPAAKPVGLGVPQAIGHLHSHRCPVDGTTWVHSESSFGNAADHKCPKCGRLVWDIHQQNVQAAKPVALPVFQSGGNCPGGVCPAPVRRRR